MRLMQRIELFLFQTRLIVMIPVLIAVLMALAVLLLSTVDAITLMGRVIEALNPVAVTARADLDKVLVSSVIELIDDFLFGAFLIVFAFGLYELFIGKIDIIENSEVMERLLLIRTLDDLKSRLANVVVLILIVKFFQNAVNVKYTTVTDLLFLAVGIVLIGGTLYLTNKAH
jgi:uncharacterized membrane protein YqhA